MDAGVGVQLVKCLPHKQEDTCLIPRACVKAGHSGGVLVIPVLGRQRMRISVLAGQPAKRKGQAPGPAGRVHLKSKIEDEEYHLTLTSGLHVLTRVCTPTHGSAHIHAHRSPEKPLKFEQSHTNRNPERRLIVLLDSHSIAPFLSAAPRSSKPPLVRAP